MEAVNPLTSGFRQIEDGLTYQLDSRPLILVKGDGRQGPLPTKDYEGSTMSLYLSANSRRLVHFASFKAHYLSANLRHVVSRAYFATPFGGSYKQLPCVGSHAFSSEVADMLAMTGFSQQEPIDKGSIPTSLSKEVPVMGTSRLFVGVDFPPFDTERDLVLFTIDRRKEEVGPPAVLSRLLTIDDGPVWAHRKRFMWAHDKRGHDWTRKIVNPDENLPQDPHRLGLLTEAKKGLEQIGFDPSVVDAAFPDLSWADDRH